MAPEGFESLWFAPWTITLELSQHGEVLSTAFSIIERRIARFFVSSRENQNPCLVKIFRRYLDEPSIASFIARVSDSYNVATLERIAQFGNVDNRRAAILALTFLGSYPSNKVMAKALHDDDRGVRMLAEEGCYWIWSRAGNAQQQRRLNKLKRLNQGGLFSEAMAIATELCEQSADFAEAWHQLGIAQFFSGRVEDSIQSSWQALAINPFHFESAIGLGHAYLEMDERVSALECYQHAVSLNPNLESIRVQVAKMQRLS